METRTGRALAIAVLVVAAVARPSVAASGPPDKAYLERLFAAWATMDTAQIAPYYDQRPTSAWFDITPMQFKGWTEWAKGLQALFSEHKTFKLSVVGEPEFHRHGDLVWGTYLWHLDADRKDGGKDTFDGRDTTVWTKQADKWVIVHEHDSVPVAAPAPAKP